MRPGRFKKNKFEDVYSNIKKFKEIKQKLNSKFPYTKIQMIITHETVNEVDSFFKMFNPIVDDVSVISYTERGGDFDKLTEKEKIYNQKLKNSIYHLTLLTLEVSMEKLKFQKTTTM